MSHIIPSGTIARTLLLAGILLAVTVLAARSFLPASAQEGPRMINEGVKQVATFAATDEDGDDITWSIDQTLGDDAADFEISQSGVLTFMNTPNYEMPADGNLDNTYTVTVIATDDGDPSQNAREALTVMVVNLNEPGVIELSSLQPQEGTAFSVNSLEDPDGEPNIPTADTAATPVRTDLSTGADAATTNWQWARCSTMEVSTCVDIEENSTSTSYMPVEADRDHYLRVTATYADGHTTAPEAGEDIELDKTATAMSAHKVTRAVYEPVPPLFPNQDPGTTDETNLPRAYRTTTATTSRDIAENSNAGTNVGAPVTATDEGADGNQETLTYTLQPGGDAASYTIDSGTGQIKVAPGVTTLDTETNPSDTVTVRATDPTDRYSQVTVTINITNVDENPTVTDGLTSHDFPEDTVALTLGSPYTATDPEDDNASLQWSVSGNHRTRFEIAPSGQLSFVEAPNYEAPWGSGSNLAQRNTYNLTVVATDSAGNTGTRDVTVVVRNVQEEGTITLSNRGARVGTSLTATLNEPDGVSGTVTWTWSGNGTTTVRTGGTSNSFSPHAGYAGGALTILAEYDDRQAPSQSATITTGDAVLANTPAATTPVWQRGGNTVTSAVASLDEDDAAGTSVDLDGTAASDPGGDAVLSYSLSGSDSSAFTIGPTDGSLSTNSALDHEKKSIYNFTISVKNRANRSANLSVRVNVGDVDEQPVFTSGATSTDHADDSSSLRVGGSGNRYVASDPEGETVTLTLGGIDAEDFNFQNGILSFKASPNYEAAIDANTNNEYVVTITASDSTTAGVDQTVTINVTNVDEDGEVELDALAPQSGVSLQATLTDPDGITADSQRWTWSNSNSRNGPWTTSSGTGATTTEDASTADYIPNEDDIGKYLRAFVVYTDGQSTGSPLATKTAAIVSANVVRDADYLNTAPIFPGQEPDEGVVDPPNVSRTTNATTSREIAENSPAGTNVGAAVAAVDLDGNRQQQVLTYTMADTTDGSGDSSDFEIGRGTGQITVAQDADLNYDVASADDREFDVTVTATDPSGLTSSSEVTITVTNVDEPPEITEATDEANLASTSTPENTASTTVLSTYAATDDEDDLATISLKWSLEGSDKDLFRLCTDADDATTCSAEVEAASVELTFKDDNLNNYEAPDDAGRNNVYDVIVTVTDDDDMPDSRSVAVTVTNDEEGGTVRLSNRQPEVGTPITATLEDPDEGVTGITWKWEFSAVTGGAADCTGAAGWSDLRAANSRSYTPVEDDVDRCLRATATYTDNADIESENDDTTACDESESDCAERVSPVPVQAKPATNATPQFADEDPGVPGNQTVRHVKENSDPGTVVTVDDEGDAAATASNDYVTATDADVAVGTVPADVLTYTLSGSDQASFEIDEATGEITVADGTELDFEAPKNTYTVIVTATDSSRASDSITVTINVVDVNEAPVIMERGVSVSGLGSVPYDEGNTAVVATYSATGPDAAGATLSLSGTDASDFTFSGGVLSFSSPPDFENPADANSDNEYDLIVTATMGTFTHALDVTVTVANVDEPGTVALSYDQNQVRVGVEITAEEPDDPDGGVTGVTWQWESSSDGSTGWSDIAGATSATYTPVEGDVGNFLRAEASYTDDQGAGKTATSDATTEVLPATTAGTPGTLALSIPQPIIGNSITASLTDADNPVLATYSWEWERSTNNTSWSAVSGAASATYTVGTADAGNYLRATVTYTDDSGPGQTATAATTRRVPVDADYDADYDGTISGSEVLQAVRHYFDGVIDGPRVLRVVRLYFDGLN